MNSNLILFDIHFAALSLPLSSVPTLMFTEYSESILHNTQTAGHDGNMKLKPVKAEVEKPGFRYIYISRYLQQPDRTVLARSSMGT